MMKKNKYFILIVLIIALIAGTINIAMKNRNSLNGEKFEIAVYNTDMITYTYHFTLTKDGMVKMEQGERKNLFVSLYKRPYLNKVIIRDEIKLSPEIIDGIFSMASAACNCGISEEEKWSRTGSWVVQVLYKGKIAENFYTNGAQAMRDLIDEVIAQTGMMDTDSTRWTNYGGKGHLDMQ